jgi:hypothetical protein
MHIFRRLWISMVALTMFVSGGPGLPDGGNPDNTGLSDGGSSGGIELTQSINLQDDLLGISATVLYPDYWFVQSFAENGIIIASSDEATVNSILEGDAPDKIPDGSVFVMVAFFPGEMASLMEIDADASLTDALSAISELMGSDEAEISEPIEITVNGITMAQVEISEKEDAGLALMSKVGDTFVFVTCATNPGKVEEHKDECIAIAASIEVK